MESRRGGARMGAGTRRGVAQGRRSPPRAPPSARRGQPRKTAGSVISRSPPRTCLSTNARIPARASGAWLRSQAAEARAVILALVDKYVLGGLREMTDPAVLRVSPFREMGEARGVLRRFGGDPQRFRAAMSELQRRLYADAA